MHIFFVFFFPGLATLLAGIILLQTSDHGWLGIFLGILSICYGLYMMLSDSCKKQEDAE